MQLQIGYKGNAFLFVPPSAHAWREHAAIVRPYFKNLPGPRQRAQNIRAAADEGGNPSGSKGLFNFVTDNPSSRNVSSDTLVY